MAGMQTRRYPTSTATMTRPGFNPLVIEDEPTWYMEMLNASAIQNPSRDGQVHFLSSESKDTGSRSLFELRPSLPLANDPGSVCSRKRSTKPGAIVVTLRNLCFFEENPVINLRGNLIERAWRLKNFPTLFLRENFSNQKGTENIEGERGNLTYAY